MSGVTLRVNGTDVEVEKHTLGVGPVLLVLYARERATFEEFASLQRAAVELRDGLCAAGANVTTVALPHGYRVETMPFTGVPQFHFDPADLPDPEHPVIRETATDERLVK